MHRQISYPSPADFRMMGPGCTNMVLVVVDDDRDMRRALDRLLRSRGHVVYVFESAEAYLARGCKADCAILDIHLPGMDGIELEGRLRNTEKNLPVVFITGRDDEATCAAVRAVDAPFLRKPFDETRLLDAIARATAIHA
jgi:FixJ family two-component response regulator